MKIWLNTRLLDAKKAHVSVFDHGFLYGDGLYETVHVYNGRIFHWPDHFKRLKQSARLLELSCPWSSAYLLKAIQRVLKANRDLNASVRITISRGPGPLGLDPRVCPNPTLVMLLHPTRDMTSIRKSGVTIGIPEVRRNHPRCLNPQIKSNNSLNTILAKMEGTRMKVFETVLLNLSDELTEGTTTNLFFVKGKTIFTPALFCGLLEGVTRGVVMKLARKSGLTVREGAYHVSDLKKADELFLTSTTMEVVPVVRVLAPTPVWRGKPGLITRGLQELFRRHVLSYSSR